MPAAARPPRASAARSAARPGGVRTGQQLVQRRMHARTHDLRQPQCGEAEQARAPADRRPAPPQGPAPSRARRACRQAARNRPGWRPTGCAGGSAARAPAAARGSAANCAARLAAARRGGGAEIDVDRGQRRRRVRSTCARRRAAPPPVRPAPRLRPPARRRTPRRPRAAARRASERSAAATAASSTSTGAAGVQRGQALQRAGAAAQQRRRAAARPAPLGRRRARAVSRGPLPPCAARVTRTPSTWPSVGAGAASLSGRKPSPRRAGRTNAPAMAGTRAATRPRCRSPTPSGAPGRQSA